MFAILLTLTSYIFFLFFFRLKFLLCPNDFGLFFISLVSHFSNRFDKNMFYMLAYGLHKMLKILIEIIVQIFHDINFFSAFFVFFLFFWA